MAAFWAGFVTGAVVGMVVLVVYAALVCAARADEEEE